MLRMMAAPDDFVGPVNLGNPHEFTILELAELVLELTGSKSELVFEPLPVDDPTRRCPDITLARKNLKWHPTIDLAHRSGEDDRLVSLDRHGAVPPADAELLSDTTPRRPAIIKPDTFPTRRERWCASGASLTDRSQVDLRA